MKNVTSLYHNLHLTCLDAAGHMSTCNYWYCIGASSLNHTAFTVRQHMLDWLSLLGLEITGDLPPEKTYAHFSITGSYRRVTWLDTSGFGAIPALIEIPVLENGNYTRGKITLDADGLRSLHVMNCNYPHITMDHAACRTLRG